MQRRPRKGNVELVISDDQTRNLLTDTVSQTDNAQLLNVRRVSVNLFELVGIDVLAVRIDNDLFRSAHEIKIAVVVNATEVTCVEPAIDECLARCTLVFVVAEHHVWTTCNNLTNAGRVRIRNANFNARQRLADGSGQHSILRTGDSQHW